MQVIGQRTAGAIKGQALARQMLTSVGLVLAAILTLSVVALAADQGFV